MKRRISVFIASPGDLASERCAFKEAIEQLNVGFGDGAGIEFVPSYWEDMLASTGRRNQGVINEEIDKCDVFILVMHRRWGQDAPDAAPYTSYTEEEFYRALDRWKRDGSPEIFVFFKRVEAASEADPGFQLKKVMDFRKQLEDTRQIRYHYFDDERGFIDEVDRHLRAYAKGELPKADRKRDIVIFPLEALEELKKAQSNAEEKALEAERAHDKAESVRLKLEALQLQMANDAADLSREGKIEYARQKFSELIVETADIRILSLGYEFFYRTGDLDSAFEALKKWLNLSGPEQTTSETAAAYGNLGILYNMRGDLDRAEEMYRRSLVIEVALGHQEGMANQYGNLGNLYQMRGELDRAEEMCEKALAIDEAIGSKEGMAIGYDNLGNLYRTRGELDRAEEMYWKSLAIEGELGRNEGVASSYGNLGILYDTRGELDRAKEMYEKALAINEVLGRKKGIANQYGNLGNLYQTRGELDRAEEMYEMALVLNQALGSKDGMASNYGNIGILYETRGEFDRAEEMYEKALVINEALARKEGLANQYGNLGNLYRRRGELDRAEEMYRNSSAINEALYHKEGLARDYGNLGNLYKTRGELDSAEEMYRKALRLFSELKSPQAAKIREMLKGLR